MADDLIPILTRFHRETFLPDFERIVGNAVEGSERRLRDELHALFDSLSRQIEELRKEQVRTIEARLEE